MCQSDCGEQVSARLNLELEVSTKYLHGHMVPW